MGVERKTAVRSQEALRRTAIHESGHALVALCTPGASPIHKATIVPRGHALGMVTQARLPGGGGGRPSLGVGMWGPLTHIRTTTYTLAHF
jgi:hypothetical protein